MGLVPMNLNLAQAAAPQSDERDSFHFAPSPGSPFFAQHRKNTDSATARDHLDRTNLANDFELHPKR
ncbi:MAG TPA: hypothetical protein VF975_07490 [Thermoanaerobaculia bacterium]